MEKNFLISGVSGQDGSYLARLALRNGFKVHAINRETKLEENQQTVKPFKELGLEGNINFHKINLMNYTQLKDFLNKLQPDYFAHLGAQSSVAKSYKDKDFTLESNFVISKNIIDSINECSKDTILFFPSSAAIFEGYRNITVNELTVPKPKTNYAYSKYLTQKYIKKNITNNDLQINTGIMFSHESIFRKKEYFSKKIIKFLTDYKKRSQSVINQKLLVGDINIQRDIGYAPDYVDAIYKILLNNDKSEYIVSSNKLIKLSTFIDICLKILDISFVKEYKNKSITYIDKSNNIELITSISDKIRKYDIRGIKGDNYKILKNIGWSPATGIEEICEIMINYELSKID